MSAENFPITFGYGAVDNVYYGEHGSIGKYHRGEDRAMPDGTPVIVNGIQIGLSGHSGAASGPHLHIGRYMGGQDTNPSGAGFTFANAVVTQVNSDATNGEYVRIQADGASWVYLHLSSQTVKQGQVLAAAPPAPIPTVATYQVTETYPAGKQIKLNKQPTNLWGMNYHFDYMKDHPVEVHAQGEIWTVTNRVHHEDGYDYYRRDGQVDGFNTLDCDDYTPPGPPAAPLPIPTSKSPYTVIKTIFGFDSATNAGNQTNAKSDVAAGSYYVFNTYPGKPNLINVTKIPGKPESWINTDYNVPDAPEPEPVNPRVAEKERMVTNRVPAPPPDPVVEPAASPAPSPVFHDSEAMIRTSIDWFDSIPPHSPIQVRALKPTRVLEVLGKTDKTFKLELGGEYHIYGTLVKDGQVYALFRDGKDPHFDFLFCCSVKSRSDLDPLDDIYSVADRMFYGAERIYFSVHKTIDGFFRPKRKR